MVESQKNTKFVLFTLATDFGIMLYDYYLRIGANLYNALGQMDLSDRTAIEVSLYKGETFARIAKRLKRHPSTIANEIRTNRTFIHDTYPAGKDCRYAKNCKLKRICMPHPDDLCNMRCIACRLVDCRSICDKYESIACHKYERPPYVCNACTRKKWCNKEKYIYVAKYADAAVERRRSESRQGFRISDEALKRMDELITELVRKGQPLTHIYAEHKKELPVGLRSLYNYIDSGKMTIRNIDLRRKVGYKPRRKHKPLSLGFQNQEYRQTRTYEDFQYAMKVQFTEDELVEMDTVKGVRERGKRLLTMIFVKNSVMLLFLMPDGTATSVKRVFDFLERGLGLEVFRRLFPVILTDNGGEFKRVDDLELTDDFEYRTRLYYCDPMASWQKAHIEKNHEFIRYVIKKGRSLNPYTDEDITLLMNHINSTKRPSLGFKCPYELIDDDDEDMKALMALMKMDLIPADEVHLTPELLNI